MRGFERNQVVAKVIVPEGVNVHKQDYATACWWTDLDLVPGEYELKADNRAGLTYMLWCSIPGKVTKAHFPSGFGGMYYANPEGDKRNIGRMENYSIHRYDYQLQEETLKSGIRIIPCV